ncbi:hypothetical protein [Pantoea sp. SGAir0184]
MRNPLSDKPLFLSKKQKHTGEGGGVRVDKPSSERNNIDPGQDSLAIFCTKCAPLLFSRREIMSVLSPVVGALLLTVLPLTVGIITAATSCLNAPTLWQCVRMAPLPFVVSAGCTLLLSALCCLLQYLTDRH